MIAEQRVRRVAASVGLPPRRRGDLRVFLSYRRQDSGGYAGHLHEDLAARFGSDAVFMDLKVPGGADFVEQIEAGVGSCDALLHLIGPHWLDVRDSTGGRRLDDPGDYTRRELARALERGVRVIPVLVGGASMPRPEALPDDIRAIVRLQAVELSDSRWDYDVGKVIAALDQRRTPARRLFTPRRGAALVLLATAAAASAALLTSRDQQQSGRGTGTHTAIVQVARAVQIPTGNRPVAVAVGEGAVWVANQADGTVTRIDPSTRAVVGRAIPVGREPTAIAVAGGTVWVALAGGALTRIDPKSSQPLAGHIAVGGVPTALLPVHGAVWVTVAARNTVVRFDAGTGARLGSPVRVGAAPTALAAGFGSVWVTNGDDGTVTKIGERTAKPEGSPVLVGTDPAGVTAAAGRVWVSNSSDDVLVSIDPATGRLTGHPIHVGRTPLGLTSVGATLSVVTESGDALVRVDARSGAIKGRPVAVGRSPASVAVGAGGTWVANQEDHSVSFVSPSVR